MYKFLCFSLLASFSLQSYSHESKTESVNITGHKINLVGDAISASEGVVGQTEIAIRPLLRTGEVLELVPGMVVTQHSGSGKANQYFLRGFNLDHGTDFATFVDNMPVNMVSHGHGQGYTDVNFIIPEAVSMMTYKKGAYYADVGDFSGAGSVSVSTAKELENDLVSLTIGEYGYQRALFMGDEQLFDGNTLVAFEANRYDGPWTDISEDIEKYNLLLKHSRDLSDGILSLTVMGYDNAWNSADQIPTRAVEQGIIDEFGSLDDSVGGESSRYSVSASWQNTAWQASAFLIDYDLNLWSNFTYFLDDESNGDQFEQVDARRIYGANLEYNDDGQFFSYAMNNRYGFQARFDDIDEVGLYQTQARERLGVTRSDQIEQSSLGVFWENKIVWNHHLRTVFGLRYDTIDYDVTSLVDTNRFGVDLSDNGGAANDSLFSTKASVIYSFNDLWESYLSAGQGFHSNDARGAVISIDPSSGDEVQTVDPLVRSEGYELGLRGFLLDRLNISFALWTLDLDSELLFVGDAGNTEASRPSTRNGFEFVANYYFTENLSADFEYAYTDAKFSDDSEEGDHIPGAIEGVVQAGLNVGLAKNWLGSLRVRHFGKRPLIEDGSVESDSTTTWNLRAAYQKAKWRVTADALNLLDSNDHDIDYFYGSRLQTEASGAEVEDIHYHVIEPRTIRLTAEYQF